MNIANKQHWKQRSWNIYNSNYISLFNKWNLNILYTLTIDYVLIDWLITCQLKLIVDPWPAIVRFLGADKKSSGSMYRVIIIVIIVQIKYNNNNYINDNREDNKSWNHKFCSDKNENYDKVIRIMVK